MFPVSLVNRPDTFDALMADIAASIEQEQPVYLHQHHIEDEHENRTMETTIEAMRQLHAQGRNHIWAYYTRNLVRPVALAQRKVDVIVGNPPLDQLQPDGQRTPDGTGNLSRNTYGIWQGGRYATHQDVAGLFFTRSMDLYLQHNGIIGMVMPHSALQAGTVFQVAHREMAGQGGGRILRSRLQLQARLGPGTAGTEHVLPHRVLSGFRPAGRRGIGGQGPGRPG